MATGDYTAGVSFSTTEAREERAAWPTNPHQNHRSRFWAWLFAAACGIIPILTLGGAIPGAIGFGGAAACVGIARDDTKPIGVRLAICVGITILCWGLVIALLGGLAMFQR